MRRLLDTLRYLKPQNQRTAEARAASLITEKKGQLE